MTIGPNTSRGGKSETVGKSEEKQRNQSICPSPYASTKLSPTANKPNTGVMKAYCTVPACRKGKREMDGWRKGGREEGREEGREGGRERGMDGWMDG